MTSEEGGAQWNLGGKLVIKAQLGDDIRRIPIHNEDITYDELVLMMQRVFRGKLTTNDEVLLKYKDEDGDLVTIFDSSDLTSAIQCGRTLKLTLFLLNKKEDAQDVPVPNGIANVAIVRKELAAIRDRVIQLLDQLDLTPKEHITSVDTTQQAEAEKAHQTLKQVGPPVQAKEFDPYQQADNDHKADKVSQAFGLEPTVSTENSPLAPPSQPNPQAQMQSQPHTLTPSATPNTLQPQAPPASSQHSMSAQPPMGSPYAPSGYHQQRFPTAQPTGTYAVPNQQQQQTSYPQGSYNPQPAQQPYASNLGYGSQPGTPQQQQQQQPAQRMPTAYGAMPSQPPTNFSQTPGPQNPGLGQPAPPPQPGYSYSGYPPASGAPTNPYSRAAQAPYGARPQPPQY